MHKHCEKLTNLFGSEKKSKSIVYSVAYGKSPQLIKDIKTKMLSGVATSIEPG